MNRTPRRRSRAMATLSAGALAAVLFVGCGDDDVDATAEDARDRAGDLVNETAARAQAEAFRALLKQKAGDDAAKHRSMSVLSDALDDLPGEVTSSGLADGNNDGLDDDGKIQLEARGSLACVSIEGTNTTVANGGC